MDNVMQKRMKELKYDSDLQYSRGYTKRSNRFCFALLLWDKHWMCNMCIGDILHKSLKC